MALLLHFYWNSAFQWKMFHHVHGYYGLHPVDVSSYQGADIDRRAGSMGSLNVIVYHLLRVKINLAYR